MCDMCDSEKTVIQYLVQTFLGQSKHSMPDNQTCSSLNGHYDNKKKTCALPTHRTEISRKSTGLATTFVLV